MAQVTRKQQQQERERARIYAARKQVHEHRQRRLGRDNLLAAIIGVVLVAAAVTAQVLFVTVGPGKPLTDANGVPLATLAEDATWTGTLDLNEVELGIELDGAAAPQAVSSFLYLSDHDFFTGLSCHRITTGEEFKVLQCGDPNGDGTGGPGYTFGPIENAPEDGLYPAGTIAMARGAEANSAGSQFFIVYGDTVLPSDTGGYTVMGTVTSGLEELTAQITDAGVVDDGTGATDGTPAVTTVITGVTLQKSVQ